LLNIYKVQYALETIGMKFPEVISPGLD